MCVLIYRVYDPLMGNLTFVAPGRTKRDKFHSASANTASINFALHYFAECKLIITVCIYVLVYCL